jgi:tetratricopeptide (TPR) repeat protein
MEQAVKVAEKKDDAHYNYARLIYEKEVTMSDKPYAAWSLDKAMEEATKAYELNPMPLYRYQQATILYAQKRFDEAKERFLELKDTPLRSAEVFYDASRCAEQLKDTTAQLALMDSVMSMFSQPYLQEAAPYLLARAQVRMGAGKSREAVADLNDYEKLMRTKLNDRFYYIRYQADMGGRLFQMALNDIDKAI